MLIDFETVIYHPKTGKEIPVEVEASVWGPEPDIGAPADASIESVRFAYSRKEIPDDIFESLDLEILKEEAIEIWEQL